MPLLSEKMTWTLVAGGAAILGAAVARRGLRAAWKAWKHADPPEDPTDPQISWGEAVAWTALVGAAIGVARLLATRAASDGWLHTTGHRPPR
jgi:hypothetical protein